ncbi:MAG: helix-turn-helix transcriptional regulator [Turicibacter sp.]|nr:helix-turn-helix transcriptional regulator [Turicibacter sp.]
MPRADRKYYCNKELTLSMIGGKWKMLILWRLNKEGTKRFSEIKALMPDITQRVLINQLREMEDDQLIERTVYPEVPPKVEYAVTDWGKSLYPILQVMYDWGDAYVTAFGVELLDKRKTQDLQGVKGEGI